MKIDRRKLDKLVSEKYLSVQKHPATDLFIYNYTEKAQYDRYWTEETLMCRGLILDKEGNIVARPFRKFFNLEEHIGEDSKLPPLPIERFIVSEKMDGSLLIVTKWKDKLITATRGSFVSDQAIKGTEILKKKQSVEFMEGLTWLFEVIFPENRIVCNYGKIEDLYLLAIIDNETGIETPPYVVNQEIFPVPEKYDGVDNITKLREKTEDNKEGFVITFESGTKVKCKYAEYVRLHRLVTGVNKKTIWELLKNHQPFDELLERIPDEFMEWIKNTRRELKNEYEVIEVLAQNIFEQIENLPTRKDQAIAIMKDKDYREYSSIVFKMLDKEPYEDLIWKMTRPQADKPFKKEI